MVSLVIKVVLNVRMSSRASKLLVIFSDFNQTLLLCKILVKFPIIKFHEKIRVVETDLFHAD